MPLVQTPRNHQFPLTALVAAGLTIFDTLVGVHVYQSKHPPQTIVEIDTATPLKSRELRFVDAGDGASVYGGHVSVFDATTGTRLPPLREKKTCL